MLLVVASAPSRITCTETVLPEARSRCMLGGMTRTAWQRPRSIMSSICAADVSTSHTVKYPVCVRASSMVRLAVDRSWS